MAVLSKDDSAPSITIIGNNPSTGSGSSSSRSLGYDRQNIKDVKRLGYSSATLKIEVNEPPPHNATALQKMRRDMLKLPYPIFIKTVLDYQLSTHQDYLENFVRVFRRLDSDVDGVLNAAEFKECFQELLQARVAAAPSSEQKHDGDIPSLPLTAKKGRKPSQRADEEERASGNGRVMTKQEMKTFLGLLKLLDPFGTDRIIFSAAVMCINKINVD